MKKIKEARILAIGDYCSHKVIQNIKVSSFTEEACTIAELEEGHRQEYYEIVWLKRGSGVHEIDTVNYAYSGSVLFMLSPGQLHRIFPQEKAEGYVVKFLPALFSDAKDLDEYLVKTMLFDNIQAEPVIKLNASVHLMIEDVLQKMEAEFNNNETDREKVMLAYLKILIIHINRLKKINVSQGQLNVNIDFSIFQRYKQEVEKYFQSQHSVEGYASALGTKTRTLNNLAKKYAGKTAGDIIASRIVLEAKRALYYNTLTVKEIGFKLGFEDPAYFTRFFKKHTGLAPHEFKRKAGNLHAKMIIKK